MCWPCHCSIKGKEGEYQDRFFARTGHSSKPPSKRRLTPDEQVWHDAFSPRAPIYTVETVDQALAVIGAV